MSKINYIWLVLFLTAGAFFIFAEKASASPASAKASYQKAYSNYKRLAKSPKRKFRHLWEKVIADFDGVIARHPRSEYAAKALFAKGEAYSDLYKISRSQKDLDAAIETYEQLLLKYPRSKDASAAKARIKTFTGVEPHAHSSAKAAQVTDASSDAAAAAGMVEVKDIRNWSNEGYTRVVLDIGGPVKLKTGKLRNPDRLVFDLKPAKLASSLSGAREVKDGILRTIRASQYQADTVRVVLDLESLAEYKTLLLPNPQRLVIDVSGKQAAARKGRGPGRLITIRSAENTSNTQPLALTSQSMPPANQEVVRQEQVEIQEAPATEASEGTPLTAKYTPTDTVPADAPKAEESSPKPIIVKNTRAVCIGTIVIDPGHGGKDTGAIGRNGLLEKEVVLDIGLRLRDIISREFGCKVVMTRDRDVFIDLSARPGVAIKHDADLFISIHANASLDRSARGIETYLLNTTKDRNIMKLAAMENAMTIEQLKDFELLSVVNQIQKDLVLDYKREESLRLAHAVQANLVTYLNRQSHVNDKGVKQGPFLVLYGAEMPSILTEVGFISNPDEEELLASAAYRQHVAEAIFDGIKDYIAGMKITATAKAN